MNLIILKKGRGFFSWCAGAHFRFPFTSRGSRGSYAAAFPGPFLLVLRPSSVDKMAVSSSFFSPQKLIILRAIPRYNNTFLNSFHQDWSETIHVFHVVEWVDIDNCIGWYNCNNSQDALSSLCFDTSFYSRKTRSSHSITSRMIMIRK